jgi:general L-amino acid transport system permease protein
VRRGTYRGRVGALLEFLRSCIATPLNLVLTALVLLLIAAIVPALVDWAIVDAAWQGAGSADCPNHDAACWVFIRVRFGQILYGGYPPAERWRVDLAAALALAGLAAMAAPRLPRKPLVAAVLIVVGPIVCAILLAGGVFGLSPVPTREWGGLLALTLVVALGTIAFAIPLGLLLAIARRSPLPVIRWLAVAFIELWRGVPLIPVLFMAVIMFPLFMPAGIEVDTLIRVLAALILFNAASMAEVFRGGFQAIPASQHEAAASLGLGPWRTLGLVVLPQVVKVAIPGLVNTCVSVTKETTVILILGLADLLAVIQAGAADPAWLVGDQIRSTGYFFAGLVFWSVCFSMSRLATRLERRLSLARAAAPAGR